MHGKADKSQNAHLSDEQAQMNTQVYVRSQNWAETGVCIGMPQLPLQGPDSSLHHSSDAGEPHKTA